MSIMNLERQEMDSKLNYEMKKWLIRFYLDTWQNYPNYSQNFDSYS